MESASSTLRAVEECIAARGKLINAADAALYAAKRNGRNQVWPRLMRPADEAGVTSLVPRAG